MEHFDARGEQFLIVKVADHKTSLTYGDAKLVLDEEVASWFLAFRDSVRHQRGSFGPTEPLFVTTSGGKVTNLSKDLSILASEVNETRVLNPTTARKATATIAAGMGSDVQRRIVANQMGQSSRTADAYYTSLGDDSQRVEAYQTMDNLRRRKLGVESEEDEEVIAPKSKRVKFSQEDEESLRCYFKGANKVSLDDARKFLAAHPHINRNPKQIQDKVKQLFS